MAHHQDHLELADIIAIPCSHLRFSDSYSGLTLADHKLLQSLKNANANS